MSIHDYAREGYYVRVVYRSIGGWFATVEGRIAHTRLKDRLVVDTGPANGGLYTVKHSRVEDVVLHVEPVGFAPRPYVHGDSERLDTPRDVAEAMAYRHKLRRSGIDTITMCENVSVTNKPLHRVRYVGGENEYVTSEELAQFPWRAMATSKRVM